MYVCVSFIMCITMYYMCMYVCIVVMRKCHLDKHVMVVVVVVLNGDGGALMMVIVIEFC